MWDNRIRPRAKMLTNLGLQRVPFSAYPLASGLGFRVGDYRKRTSSRFIVNKLSLDLQSSKSRTFPVTPYRFPNISPIASKRLCTPKLQELA